jgi:uncharacterized integral membrane protein (TIGR00698 family)
MSMQIIKEHLPGMALAFAVAAVAYGLGRLVPVVGGPVLGIALGILVASVWKLPAATAKGVRFTSKYVLQLAVILLGFEMNLANVIKVGQQSLLIILLTLSVALLTAYLAGRWLRLPTKLFTLIGVGTAICGGSAIAAASSAIDADDADVSYSISTIFLFNVAAVFLFPPLGHLLGLNDQGFGMWAGTAINDTSSVVAASYSFSNAAGIFATVVKLTRSLMIVPITLALALMYARAQRGETHFNFLKVFPWFVAGFLLAALISSTGLLPPDLANGLVQVGKFLIIAAMTAIGFNTNIQRFIKAGPRALALGGVTWLVVILSSLAIQYLTRFW